MQEANTYPARVEAMESPAPVALSVVLVAIGSLQHIARGLDALLAQRDAPKFETIVVADPHLGDLAPLRKKYPEAVILSREGCRTPIQLAAFGIGSANGERILLTEDSCIARADWVGRLASTEWRGRAAVGGVIEPTADISPAMWAFYFVDFFRYMKPAAEGPSPSLSVCNVAYHRSHLESVASVWEKGFHETEIHRSLQEKFGPLHLDPSAEVQVRRSVSFSDAVYERYAFGRLFAATRVASASPARRLYYLLFSPALPILLMGRMTARALGSRSALPLFIRALPSLLSMVFAWTWGEWLGYVTRRYPQRITTAPELSRAPGPGELTVGA